MMEVYDFAIGQTNPETFPMDAFRDAAIAAIEEEHDAFNRYPGGKGHAGLRQLMAERESQREGVPVDPEMIALMNGSMQAVTLAGQALMQAPGDIVITEEYTYSGTISAYKGIGLTMVGVAMDEQGMRMDALADTLQKLQRSDQKVRFIYTLTTYQNPTGTCMPLSRKKQLLEIADRYQLPIVEDNCYGDVHFDGAKVPSLYALDDSERQIYIGSLSKIFAPGVRLGYLLARKPHFNNIVSQRFDAGSNYFAAAVLAQFYKKGIWEHCDVANPVLRHKRNLVCELLNETLADFCVWSVPVGGLFIWVRLPEDIDMDKLRQVAAANNFYFAAGKDFHVDSKQVPYLRLAFGHVPDDLIKKGIPVLARSISAARTSNSARDFETLFD
ncbi:MAG TPA: PLP-dependent aminotransferase family protein [Gammaproteobacteria bacterium]|nr:PLP-dependent aminotransferase family protein [Gammaproteobacteria bacterium]HIK69174.1 PLP-dependent aminotransferase family protein [Pseudomonadales bacterium]